MNKYLSLLLAAFLVMILAACTENKFKVAGTVSGASDTTQILLESSYSGMWYVIDSTHVDASGNFSFAEDAPEFPSVYRLRMGDRVICFPIDSIDNLTVSTTLKGFDTDYTLKGTPAAEHVMQIDKEAIKYAALPRTSPEFVAWKRKVSERIVADPSGIVAYYTISKYIGNQPLYDPVDDNDLRIIGAVANAFNTFRPNDPRTRYLVEVLLAGQQRRRSANAVADTVYADVASIIDIKLQDNTGKEQVLSQVTQQHNVVILNFTMYQGQFSPMFNKMLNDLYTQYHSRGMEIYQVSLDENAADWRQAAQPLPWITVYDGMGQNSANVGAYQVNGVPTTFIIKNGEIVERIEDGTQLKAAVARQF